MANNTNKNNKNSKTFFKDFKAELKKVVWPTPKQVLNSTLGVIIVVIITAIIVFVLDFAFEGLNKYGVNKLKGIVENTSQNNTLVENQNNTTENQTETNETTNGNNETEAANTTENEDNSLENGNESTGQE